MKKKFTHISILAVFMAFSSLMSYAQQEQQPPCFNALTGLFGSTAYTTPKTLNRLGSAPQFGKIPAHTAESAYSHLSRVAKRSSRSRKEIDRILRAIGYSGIQDPSFSSSSITPEVVPAGTTGWMGAYARGHKYAWSTLGRDFNGYRVQSLDGQCSLLIMQQCGNAFYIPTTWVAPVTYVAPVVTCKTQTISVVGASEIKGGSVINSTMELPIVANYSNGVTNTALCLGTQSVPVRVTYDLAVAGQSKYTKTIQVCDRDDSGIASAVDLKLPVNLDFDVTGSEVSVDGGAISMDINENQFKSLSKVFEVCPTDMTMAAASTMESTSTDSNVDSISDHSEMASVSTQNCKKQTINFVGSASSDASNAKATTQEVTVIGVYNAGLDSKLMLGEKADKYLCLGSYSVPANTLVNYNVKGDAKASKIVEICDDGSQKDIDNVTVPVTLTHNFTKQDLMIGDYGKVYVPLTAAQYKSLSKKFSRCCTNASLDAKCN